MLKQENGDTSKNWARICDSCQSAACTVYCRADTAYLCSNCDSNIHSATNRVASRHERVWVCEACERAPAAVLCKADSASLCTTCDAEIHSANPLARRHQRVPILPLPGSLYGPSAPTTRELLMAPTRDVGPNDDFKVDEEDEDDETSSWLLLNPVKIGGNQANNNGQLLSEVDDYLDLEEYNSCQDHVNFNEDHQHNNQKQHYNVISDHEHKMYGGDSVVPVQYGSNGGKEEVHQNSFHLGMEYEVSSTAGYGYPMHHSVSLSSMDVGVVPESRMSEDSSSISQQRASKGTIDLFSNDPTALQMPTQLSAIDREARVLRYREKKKMRKFEKTIRYASRKAYAETRPRIKGRFAKRTDNADEMFSTSLMADHSATAGYGIVPSF